MLTHSRKVRGFEPVRSLAYELCSLGRQTSRIYTSNGDLFFFKILKLPL